MAEIDEKDEITALTFATDGLFVVGHVSGMLRGWRLPEPWDSSDEEDEEEEEEEEAKEE